MQLLVFTMKPMTVEKRALGLQGDEYEKARICLQGQNHEGFQIHNSTNNADAHLLRLFLSVYASSKNVLASFDVSNAFLNAELSEEVSILTQPAPELVQFGLVKPGTLYQCTKACYGLREAPKLWEQLSASKTRARHLSMRASWLHHLVQRENVSMQFVPTTYQKADILTKGLQAYSHELAREGLRLRLCNGL